MLPRLPRSLASSFTRTARLSSPLTPASPSPSPVRAFSTGASAMAASHPDLLSGPTIPCLVDGAARTFSASYEVRDPHFPDRVVHSASAVSTEAEVAEVLAAADKAAQKWKRTSVLERRRIFLKAAQLLGERVNEYAKQEVEETTSTLPWSGFEMSIAKEALEETAAAATMALRGEICTTDNSQKAYIERHSYNVVLSMAPWNAPTVLTMRSIAQPLMAGNAVILKTSEVSPRTQLALGQVFTEAGLPPGVLNVVHVRPADAPRVVEQLIAHSAVGKVNFTGSTVVGSAIGQMCGRHIKPVVLELGGKAPAVVLADADLEFTAQAVMFGAWFHSGQICMATQSLIVHESVKDKLLSLIKAHVTTVKASKDLAAGTKLRGLFKPEAAQRVKDCVDDALAKGATVAAGEYGFDGNVVQPLLLEGVTSDMRIYKEEMFAPVFSLLTFQTADEAVFIANDHDYGLAASVFTRDTNAGFDLARRIDAGMVHVNGPTVHDSAQVPHGGWKKSGFGRFNGFEGIREFTQTKVITINEPHPFPI